MKNFCKKQVSTAKISFVKQKEFRPSHCKNQFTRKLVPLNAVCLLKIVISSQTRKTDFSNQESFEQLLKHLSDVFLELKHHEEIENKCIMKILKRKLQGDALKKLLIHLHAHSHISDILKLVNKVESEFQSGLCENLKLLGSNLNESLEEFFEEYVPHMKEEEQVKQMQRCVFLYLIKFLIFFKNLKFMIM